ncbi:hypothetical protein TRVA0_012S00408 [Trichomonascus vanleenenianus]|uniref:enoyl-CoA hydratase/isomerase family protein n=1 Tax=Trichomonascus vanleenenianus TaxID=2268995 RepID=UPI003ECBA137
MIDYSKFSTDIYKVEVIKHRILLVTLNRPKALNSIPQAYHKKMSELWELMEQDGSLVAGIITGTGRVFSAGADLKDWHSKKAAGDNDSQEPRSFMGLSNRMSKKPVIAALNGSSYGGGTETVVNCDLAVAVRSATLSLPEVRRGVTAMAGALPRIGRQLGLKRANELALIGEPISAETALNWGLINRVVETQQEVLPAAIEMADKIALGSPEAIQASLISIRRGVDETRFSSTEATKHGMEQEHRQVMSMDNVLEGLAAFKEKREPKWKPSKL